MTFSAKGSAAMRILRFLAVLPLPLIYAFSAWRAVQDRFFVSNHSYFADPGYAYLLNGQAFLNDKVIYHIDHPGTPVQIINGLLQQAIWRTNIFGTRAQLLEVGVVATAERHQLAVAVTLVALQTLGAVLLGLVLAKCLALWVAPISQFLLLEMSRPLLGDSIANKPEGFVLSFGLLALSSLIFIIARPPSGWRNYALLVSFSLLLALTITSKISAVLLALLLPLTLAKWKSILFTYLLTSTFVLVILFFVWPMMPTAWRFWTMSGGGALSDPWALLNKAIASTSQGITAALIAISALTIVFAILASLVDASARFRWLAFLLISFVILLGQLAIASARNYPWIVPAVPVAAAGAGVAAALLVNIWSQSLNFNWRNKLQSQTLQTSVGFALLLLLIWPALQGIPPSPQGRPDDAVQAAEAQWLSRGDLIVYDWSIGFSGLPYGNECAALIFGNGFARQVVSPLLAEKCPNHRLGAFVNDRLQQYGNGSVSCQELQRELDSGRRVAFLRPSSTYVPREFDLETIAEAGGWQFSAVTIKACL
jgi:hypothetical protein